MTRTKPNTQKNSVQFTRQTIHEISTDINEALKIIAEKYGMAKMSLGSISFDSTSFSGRLTAFSGRLTADATTPDKDPKQEIYLRLFGLPEDLIGKHLVIQGINFEIARIDPKKRIYPVIADKLDSSGNKTGKQYKLPVSYVTAALNK